jgi:hypothetical protein
MSEYLDNEYLPKTSLVSYISGWPEAIRSFFDAKLAEKWDMTLNVKVPFFVIPEYGSFLK